MNANKLFHLLEANRENVPLLTDLIDTYSDLLNSTTNLLRDYILLITVERKYKILLEQLIECPKINIDVQDKHLNTALIYAVYNGSPDLAISLINAGANVNLQDNSGKNAIAYIDNIKNEDSRSQVKKLLLEKMGNLGDMARKQIAIGKLGHLMCKHKTDTKFITDIVNDHKDIINVLMSDNVNNLLYLAVDHGSTIMTKALIDAGIDLNWVSQYGNTCLLRAIKENRPDIAIQLIEAGADTTIKDRKRLVAFKLIHNIYDHDKRDKIRELLESKIPKPVETPKPEEIKPVEPVSQIIVEGSSVTAEGPYSILGSKKPDTYCQLIKFLGETKIDYSFSNYEITAESSDKLTAFAFEFNIAYKVQGNNIVMALK